MEAEAPEKPGRSSGSTTSHGLVIGIDHYGCEAWPGLRYARADAASIEQLLDSRGFEVTALYDRQATRAAIFSALEGLAVAMEEGDRFVFFFAGHGSSHLYNSRKWGFVVPSDCSSSANFISMQELRDWAERLGRAHHQLFVLDACFSGLFGQVRGVEVSGPAGRTHLTDLQLFPARQYITAGTGDQQVLDGGEDGHSLFTGQLLKALKDGRADSNRDGYVTFNELGVYLEAAAWNVGQTPVFGDLPGHEGGAFVFPLDGAPALPRITDKPFQTSPKKPAVRDTASPTFSFPTVEIKEGKPARLAGGIADASVSFSAQSGIELATLIISPAQGRPSRIPILAAGATGSFTNGGQSYEITVMALDWQGQTVTLSVRGPEPGASP